MDCVLKTSNDSCTICDNNNQSNIINKKKIPEPAVVVNEIPFALVGGMCL